MWCWECLSVRHRYHGCCWRAHHHLVGCAVPRTLGLWTRSDSTVNSRYIAGPNSCSPDRWDARTAQWYPLWSIDGYTAFTLLYSCVWWYHVHKSSIKYYLQHRIPGKPQICTALANYPAQDHCYSCDNARPRTPQLNHGPVLSILLGQRVIKRRLSSASLHVRVQTALNRRWWIRIKRGISNSCQWIEQIWAIIPESSVICRVVQKLYTYRVWVSLAAVGFSFVIRIDPRLEIFQIDFKLLILWTWSSVKY